ncbi:MAG: GNAT family N-acetyltransferase [Salinivirgaceae bacterium]
MYRINQRLLIRTWQFGDESFLASQANNKMIWNYVLDIFPHPYTYDDACTWIEINRKKDKAENFALVYDGDPIGNIGIMPGADVHRKSVAMGYWLGQEYWGKGIATLAVQWMVAYTFNEFDFNRIWAAVFSNNPASMRVLQKAGFKQEAILEKSVIKNGEYLNEHIFAILK